MPFLCQTEKSYPGHSSGYTQSSLFIFFGPFPVLVNPFFITREAELHAVLMLRGNNAFMRAKPALHSFALNSFLNHA